MQTGSSSNMKNILYSVGAVVVSVGLSFVLFGHQIEQKLGSYTNGGVINGNAIVNDFVQGSAGFTNNGLTPQITATTTVTPAQFCNTTNEQIANTTSSITVTLPAATSSYLTCTGGFGQFGSWGPEFVTNDSTNSVTFVPGTGMKFLCETQGLGTTTVVGGCTSSSVVLNATSSAQTNGYWDGSSSTLYITWGNEFH